MKNKTFLTGSVLLVILILGGSRAMLRALGDSPLSEATDGVQGISEKKATRPLSELTLENIRSVTPSAGFFDPIWCPTRSDLLAFTGGDGTYLYSLAEDKYHKISDEKAGPGLCFTSDCKHILYRVRARLGVSEIRRMDVESGNVYKVAEGSTLGLPREIAPGIIRYRKEEDQFETVVLSPETHQRSLRPYVYHLNNQIYVEQNGEAKQITNEEEQYLSPYLSPDGERVLYNEVGEGMMVTDLRNGHTIFLGPGSDGVWSPDGQYVLFEITVDDHYDIVSSDLYITDLTGRRRRLTESIKLAMSPAVSPDGRHIAFDNDGAIFLAEMSWKDGS